MKFEWETINEASGYCTHRAKVLGGWVILHVSYDDLNESLAMVFIPDPHHAWKVD